MQFLLKEKKTFNFNQSKTCGEVEQSKKMWSKKLYQMINFQKWNLKKNINEHKLFEWKCSLLKFLHFLRLLYNLKKTIKF